MKLKIVSVLLLVLICFSMVACGENDPKRPIDYPESKWTCKDASITFSVSADCKITDATAVGNNGEIFEISFVFSEAEEGKVSITNAEGTEIYLIGDCSYESDRFTIRVTDVYNTHLGISSTRLIFERQ